jgi:hypothetical protein
LSQEASYSFTVKTPKGNLFTVRGDSFGEFKQNIIDARNGNAPAACKAFEAEVAAAPVESHEEAVRNVTDGFTGSTADPGSYDSYQGSQELPPQYGGGGAQPQQQYCNHGPMKYFANGKYGPFWACPLGRDDPNKCKLRSAK